MNDIMRITLNWNVTRSNENPLTAPLSTIEFTIRPKLVILVTNQVSGKRLDAWLIMERHSIGLNEEEKEYFRFIDTAFIQSGAVQRACDYAWTIYRFEITEADLPF